MRASQKEIHTFLKHALNAKKYLEFGCGGSTFLMLYVSMAEILSVESDPNIIAHLCSYKLIQDALQDSNTSETPASINSLAQKDLACTDSFQNPRLRFYPIDIGEVGKWGMPIDESKKSNYPLYSSHIFQSLSPIKIENIDTIFVDGRFRVACVLNTLLHCQKDSTIIIHDFFNRPQYHIVLDFLNCIEQCETMGVFKAKPDLDKIRIHTLLDTYAYQVE